MKVLIADDELPARARLREMLSEISDCEVVGEAGHGHEVLRMCEEFSPDVVLLDIRMPDMDGIEAARHLAELDAGPAVVFTTAYDSYAIDAFDAHAIGYLLKPVRQERLVRALDHALRSTSNQIDRLVRDDDPACGPDSPVCTTKRRLAPYSGGRDHVSPRGSEIRDGLPY